MDIKQENDKYRLVDYGTGYFELETLLEYEGRFGEWLQVGTLMNCDIEAFHVAIDNFEEELRCMMNFM
jgi:hypothetical protein